MEGSLAHSGAGRWLPARYRRAARHAAVAAEEAAARGAGCDFASSTAGSRTATGAVVLAATGGNSVFRCIAGGFVIVVCVCVGVCRLRCDIRVCLAVKQVFAGAVLCFHFRGRKTGQTRTRPTVSMGGQAWDTSRPEHGPEYVRVALLRIDEIRIKGG